VASSISGSANDDATVRIDVRGAADDSASTPAGTPVTIDVRANDPCSGCTLSGVSAPSSGTAVLSDGGIRYTPATGFSGTVTFSYTLTQGEASTTAEVTVSVLPEAVDDTVTALLGTDVQILPLDNDLCANCALIGVGTPTSGTASSDGDVATYSPSSVGTATFSYAAEDGSGNAFVGLITVHVVSPPFLADDEASTPSGTPAVVDVLGNDECAACDVSIASDPAHGTVTVDVFGRTVYSASPGFTGVDSFTYTATDPATGAWASATVTITVTPVARDDTAATGLGTPIVVDVLANDDCTSCEVFIEEGSVGHG